MIPGPRGSFFAGNLREARERPLEQLRVFLGLAERLPQSLLGLFQD